MATIKDIAELSNVSYTTVSLVLNGKAKERKISQKTQERVLEAAKQLHYVANIAAKQLKTAGQGRYSIAVFWPADYRISFISRLINGMNNVIPFSEDLIDIVICPYKINHLCDHAELLERAVYHGAMIAAASTADMEYLEKTDFPIPLVLLNRSSSKYSTVGADNYNAGRLAADHLIACGFTSIATVFSENQYKAMSDHHNGFLQTWESTVGPVARSFNSRNSISGGFEIAQEIFKYPSPQAIFFDTDAIARGFLCAAAQAGVKIPDDISVLAMGVYTPESSAYTVPPLTTVEIPHELFAQHGLKILMSMVKKDLQQPCHILFDAELKVRRSCCNIVK